MSNLNGNELLRTPHNKPNPRNPNPPDSYNSDTAPLQGSAFARGAAGKTKSKYPFEPLYYFNQFLTRYDGLDIETLLELAAKAGDARRVWASDDLTKQDYLEAVEQAVRDYRTSQRPENQPQRQNTWGDNYLSRQPVIAWGVSRCSVDLGITDTEEAKRLTCVALSVGYTIAIEKVDDFGLFPGNSDQAKAHINAYTQARKELMATAKKNLIWTTKYQDQLDDLCMKFNVAASQQAQMCKDILERSPEEIAEQRHPGSILEELEREIPKWVKKWMPGQPSLLDGLPEVDDELSQKFSEGGEKLKALLEETAKKQEKIDEKATPLSDTPPTPVDTPAIENKALLAPVSENPAVEGKAEKIEVSDAGVLAGKDYFYEAIWTPDLWNVTVHSIYKFTEGQQEEIKKVIRGYLQMSKNNNCLFDWTLDTPPVGLINPLRTALDSIIRDGWKELDNEQSMSQRADKLREILKTGTVVEALQLYGADEAMRLVSAARQAKLSADVAELAARQEAERQTLDKQPSALVPASPAALTVMPPISPIKVPTPAEQSLMDKIARFAVICKIYPSEAAAWLALYTGYDMGFGIPASTRLVYAFESKGKINIYVSADAYAAKCLSRQDICEKFIVTNDTPESAVAIVKRRGEPERTFTYSKTEANAASLWNNDSKPAWKQNPKAMLRHRVAREAALGAFPEICADLGITRAEDDDEEFTPVELPKAASF